MRPDRQTIEFACRLRALRLDWDRIMGVFEMAGIGKSDTQAWSAAEIRGAFDPDQLRREAIAAAFDAMNDP